MSQTSFITALLFVVAALPVGAADPGDLCIAAAREAAALSGVPEDVLLALTLTETGRASAGNDLRPWPWALNRGGKSLWFGTREEALDHLDTALDEGATNIDIGCFQLNWRWQADAFPSTAEMIDPLGNARRAAELLSWHYDRTGDWIAAAAAYHSRTPDRAERYLARFTPIHDALMADGESDPPRTSARENGFPFLRAGAAASAGSIVPLSAPIRPLFGG